jgi:2-polyprenyl-6-methoxyphenol hydroxylase-like FAD-dependent oxidoreductase
MSKLNVLIVGAGIGGPALAFWLSRAGMRSVVVERAPALRANGQTVDIRGAGFEVVRRMGLDNIIRSRTTREQGLAFVDASNRKRAEFPVDLVSGGQSIIADIEILRGELVKILYESTYNCKDIEYVLEDYPTSLKDRGDRVEVGFAKGAAREFDLVVAADGMNSKTRRLVVDGPSPLRSLGQYICYFAIPYHESDGNWARRYNAPGGRVITLRPDNLGTTRVYLQFTSNSSERYEKLDVKEQKEKMHKLFADAGWEAPRILSAMDAATDFYMQEVAQIKMEHWSKGRIVVLGDAGYCPSPISGMGTSLAIVGSYVLAGELARCKNYHDAFTSYESLMRPYVDKAQKLPPGAPRLFTPQTQFGISVLLTVLSFVSKPGLVRLFSKNVSSRPADAIELPTYDIRSR